MDRDQKAAAVKEIAGELGDAEAILAVDYRGISVPQAAELRSRLRDADASFKVVKNRLAKIAAAEAGTGGLEELLEGPTALTFVRGDVVTAAKAINGFARENADVVSFKGGLMDGETLDEERFKALARLPALDVMHGQLVGMTAAPLTGLVRGLGSMLSGLAVALGQISEQGLIGGEVPSEEPAAEEPAAEPAAEAPSAEEEPPAEEESEQEQADPDAPGSEAEGASDEDPDAPGSEAEEAAGEDSVAKEE